MIKCVLNEIWQVHILINTNLWGEMARLERVWVAACILQVHFQYLKLRHLSSTTQPVTERYLETLTRSRLVVVGHTLKCCNKVNCDGKVYGGSSEMAHTTDLRTSKLSPWKIWNKFILTIRQILHILISCVQLYFSSEDNNSLLAYPLF